MPNSLPTLGEIRRQIDHIDEELIKLLAERQRCVEKAILIKIARSLDKHIYLIVPKQVLDVAFKGDAAMPGEFVDALLDSLPSILVAVVPLPFLPPGLKTLVISAFLTPLLKALREKTTLDELI